MRQEAQTQWRRILAGKLASWAPIVIMCLAAAPQVAAQSPDLHTLIDEIEAPLHDALPEPAPLCVPIPAGGFPGVTSRSFYYLSEILPPGIGREDPACGTWLGCFLDQVTGTVHDNATLVIDRKCVSKRTLVIPDRFVLAGVGIDGEGKLEFDLPASARALRFKIPADPAAAEIRHSQIRDLSIGNESCCGHEGQIGIDLSNSTLVDIENVRVSEFAIGIGGRLSTRNTIEGSNLINNGIGIVLGFETTAWQMRENVIAFSRQAGITFNATTRASVVSGGVIDRNALGILLRGTGNTVQSTWFADNGGFAIHVPASAKSSRILTSFFTNNNILNLSPTTRRCYNTAQGPLLPDNCP